MAQECVSFFALQQGKPIGYKVQDVAIVGDTLRKASFSKFQIRLEQNLDDGVECGDTGVIHDATSQCCRYGADQSNIVQLAMRLIE